MSVDVFVSRPNKLNENQEVTMQRIEELLLNRGLRIRTIGKTDFPNVSPMKAVEQLMKQCSGAVILGFPQVIIQKGILKPNTDGEVSVENVLLPTPWNHIEASMAFMLDLPLLIIRHDRIEGGIFDIGVVDNFIHTFPLESQEWLTEQNFVQPFNEWHKEVLHKTSSRTM